MDQLLASFSFLFSVINIANGHVVTALGKNVTASSCYCFESIYPETLVDGDTNGNWHHVFCTAAKQPSGWISVDLAEEVISPQVKLYFRTDYTKRRNGVQISLSPEKGATTNFCEVITGAANGSDIPDIYNFTCDARGRYLNMSTVTDNDGDGPLLEFSEVEVYGCKPGWTSRPCDSGHLVTAHGKNVSASSCYCEQTCERIVDGDTYGKSGHVFSTDAKQPSGWISVDLAEEVISPQVILYFRTDYTKRRNGVRISLSPETGLTSDFCKVITGAADGSNIPDIYNFTCDARGRYLNISTVTDNDGLGALLEFSEVEVYAEANVDRKYMGSSDFDFFKKEPVVTKTVMKMEDIDLISLIECSVKCEALAMCVSFEYRTGTCTLWRTGSGGLSGSRDMWKKQATYNVHSLFKQE